MHGSYHHIIKHDSYRQISDTTVRAHIFSREQISISFERYEDMYKTRITLYKSVQHLHSPGLHAQESAQVQELEPQCWSTGFWMMGDMVKRIELME